MAKKRRKEGDNFFFERVERCLRDIYDEDRTDIDGILNDIKNSSENFESEFTDAEQMLFMEHFYSYDERVMNNKLFFLFEVEGPISPAYAVTSLPLRPRKEKSLLLTHVGFNRTWYNIDDACELFMEEVQKTFSNMKLVRGAEMKHHIYTVSAYD